MKLFIQFYLIIHHLFVLHGTNIYLGCFIDRIGDRDLNVFISDEMPFTVDQCLQACEIKGFLYAAIQYGNECRCGNQFGKYGQTSDDQCHYRCAKSLEMCGGNYRNSIYQTGSARPTDVRCERNLIGYQGCYVRETLPFVIGKVNTIEECVQICAQNYLYAGIRNQQYCHCGEQLNEIPSNSSLCHQQCLHNIQGECCGGENVLSVYHIQYYQSESLSDENFNLNLRIVTGSTFVSMARSTIFASFTSSNPLVTSMRTSQPSSTPTMISTQSVPRSFTSSFSSSAPITSAFSSFLTNFNTFSTASVTVTSQTPSTSPSSSFSSLSSFTANASTISDNISITSVATVLNLNTTTTTTTTTTTATTTTTPSSFYIISTIFLIYSNQSFDQTSNQSRELIRQGLSNVINLAFRCRSNVSYPNCTQIRQTRQSCTNVYRVNLLTNIVQVENGNPAKYRVDYSVVDECDSNRLVSPTVVRSATSILTRDQISNIFGYQFDSEFIQSSSISATTTSPVVDQKLWLIGATIGPVVFVLLLIFIFCYLHYKCRPRPRQTLIPPGEKKIGSPPTLTKSPIKQIPSPVEKTIPEPEVRILSQRDPLVGHDNPTIVITKDSSRSSARLNSIDIPLDELRHQNQVERWRNKIRLQEKYQPSSAPEIQSNVSPPAINILPSENVEWKPVSRLNELIYQEMPYDPDSDFERKRRRRQRRRSPSISDDPTHPIVSKNSSQPHAPIIAQVNERPDPNLIRFHYNPYEAGDRVNALSQFTPVPFTPKYSKEIDPTRYSRSDYQTTPTMFVDVADRAETATNAYGNPKKTAKTRLETDREAMIRDDEYRTNQRQHVFADEGVYVSTISKNYRDEYRIAKASVVNTKKLISTIQDDLQQIVQSDQDNYRA